MKVAEAKIRVILRWIHIVLGLAILCYIYSPFHRYIPFKIFIKFLAIPAIALSGLWIWKFKIFNKFFRIKHE